jgi:quinol monooxygenase YgiN
MSTIVISARAVPRPRDRRELRQALHDWAATVRQATGALAANLYEDVEDPPAFLVEAAWKDAAALEGHLRSDAFGVLLGALELLAEPARVTVLATVEAYAPDPLTAIRRLREGRRVPTERHTE